jgi:LacI family transcriptional regulator
MVGIPTLDDVARAAQVHPGTASRALNEETRSKVSPATVGRVLAAADRLGYTPNAVARGLRRQRSMTVGVLIPDLTNAIFPPIVRGIEESLSPRGFTAFVANTDNDDYRERRAFEAFRARQVDGFIFANARRDHGLIQEAFNLGIPSVLANRRTDKSLFPWVAGDDDDGVEQIVKHLVELGHTHVAHIAGPQNNSAGFARAESFRHFVKQHGLRELDCPVVIADAFDTESGGSATKQILHHFPAVTAIFAGNDMIAVGVLGALREAGVHCPVDMSVVGFNDMPLAKDLAPSLTTVAVSGQQLGAMAATLLLDEIAGVDRERTVLLPVELVVRESTAPPRVGALSLARQASTARE